MKKLMIFSLGSTRQIKKMLDRSLPPAPADYLPNDIVINRNWKELGWPKKKNESISGVFISHLDNSESENFKINHFTHMLC